VFGILRLVNQPRTRGITARLTFQDFPANGKNKAALLGGVVL
jgi:hypothetical protein